MDFDRKRLNPVYWEGRLNDTKQFSHAITEHGFPVETHDGRIKDDVYEYKHVILTAEQYAVYKSYRDYSWGHGYGGLVSERVLYDEIKITQSPGWEHYYIYPVSEEENKQASVMERHGKWPLSKMAIIFCALIAPAMHMLK